MTEIWLHWLISEVQHNSLCLCSVRSLFQAATEKVLSVANTSTCQWWKKFTTQVVRILSETSVSVSYVCQRVVWPSNVLWNKRQHVINPCCDWQLLTEVPVSLSTPENLKEWSCSSQDGDSTRADTSFIVIPTSKYLPVLIVFIIWL